MTPAGYGYGNRVTVIVMEHKKRIKGRKIHSDTDSTLNWKRILEQRIISFNFQVYFLRFSWIVRDRF